MPSSPVLTTGDFRCTVRPEATLQREPTRVRVPAQNGCLVAALLSVLCCKENPQLPHVSHLCLLDASVHCSHTVLPPGGNSEVDRKGEQKARGPFSSWNDQSEQRRGMAYAPRLLLWLVLGGGGQPRSGTLSSAPQPGGASDKLSPEPCTAELPQGKACPSGPKLPPHTPLSCHQQGSPTAATEPVDKKSHLLKGKRGVCKQVCQINQDSKEQQSPLAVPHCVFHWGWEADPDSCGPAVH